ncbi:ubiquitin ligase (cullin) of SCF [Yamadazyma tenuis]|uniref:SCF ubiquitin ligase n=1 Tax=Candida tenuis (strain ATCC 10573 / BCRC 21748 / CBS 615 / JCM 9827 / NBRC 10315 / NRRL Y-1498 / VKM Y-70) TaxID=590646 RepID=G3B7Q7_CANTC|nr:SCF ubiquitin ligase [Yamadazyma tenuis ATCC 10573]EGV62297.1 SCF ubiquitin ligase [Yamadazyma tenuis ATCC 10573]WEJ93552.1 ubiquitin ligase (cullin) of SCF [Yamadazyma tenuis]
MSQQQPLGSPIPFPASSDLNGTWAFIQPSLGLILGSSGDQGVTSKVYMNCYTAVYNYCTNKSRNGGSISDTGPTNPATTNSYSLAGSEIYSKLEKYLVKLITSLRKEPNESFLEFYVRRLNRFTIGAGYMNNVFDYMNRYWVQKERSDGRRDIYDVSTLCVLQWKAQMFVNNADRLIEEIMDQIERQRNNEIIDTNLISSAVKSLVYLGVDTQDLKKANLVVYINYFEKKFLEETAKYYRLESNEFLAEHNVVDYMKKCETRLNEEISRSNNYLEDHTKKALVDTLNTVLIKDHANEMYDQFISLLENNQLEHIQRMYKLMSRVPSTLEPLAESLERYIKNDAIKVIEEIKKGGESTNNDNEEVAAVTKAKKSNGPINPKTYVHSLISVYLKFNDVVNDAFEKDPIFIRALDNACRHFVNKNSIALVNPKSSSKTPEILARYADAFLRSSSKEADTYDMNTDNLMIVFKFVEDKDAFEENYRRMLAKRLINNTSKSEELEESVIKRLQEENSLEYTSKMNKMFVDMKSSEDLKMKMRDHLVEIDSSLKDFTPLILASSMWPFSKQPDYVVKFPQDLQDIIDNFTELYTKAHTGRQLDWLWNHGRSEIKANLSRKGKPAFTFIVTNVQLLILLAFNDRKTYSFSELQEVVGCPPHLLDNQITPLVKYKLFEQSPSGPQNQNKPNTTFTIVDEYKSRKLKVNFVSSLKSEQRQEDDEISKEISESRQLYLRACIVRIMKARKTISHPELYNEVVTQSLSRFHAKNTDVKKTITLLIEQNYMKRIDNSIYEYVA